jgi:hypothetical protein
MSEKSKSVSRPSEEIEFGPELPILPIRNAVLFPGAVSRLAPRTNPGGSGKVATTLGSVSVRQ